MDRLPIQQLAQKDLIKKTSQLMTDFSHNKQDIFPSILHPDILQVSNTYSQYLQDYERCYYYLEDLMPETPTSCDETANAISYEIQFYNDSMCIINSKCTWNMQSRKEDAPTHDENDNETADPLSICQNNKMSMQKLTFIWKRYLGDWKLFHIHLTTSIN